MPDAWSQAAEQEWISPPVNVGNWCAGSEAWQSTRRHRATIVERGWRAVRTLIGDEEDEIALAPALGQYVYEPDAVVLAARLTATLADEHGLDNHAWSGLSHGGPTDRGRSTGQLSGARSLAAGQAAAARALRRGTLAHLRSRNAAWIASLSNCVARMPPLGDELATLIVLPMAGRPTAILADRVARRASSVLFLEMTAWNAAILSRRIRFADCADFEEEMLGKST